jgi:hypothetical protein
MKPAMPHQWDDARTPGKSPTEYDSNGCRREHLIGRAVLGYNTLTRISDQVVKKNG